MAEPEAEPKVEPEAEPEAEPQAEPEIQIKEEPSEFPEEITTDVTDTDATEDATTIEIEDAIKYKSTDYEGIEPDVIKDEEEKEKSWLERSVEKGWSDKGEPLWQVIKS